MSSIVRQMVVDGYHRANQSDVEPQTMVRLRATDQARPLNEAELDALPTYVVTQHLITVVSAFFNAAFTSGMLDAQSETLTFYETCPIIFAIFINWMSTQQILDPSGLVVTLAQLIDLFKFSNRYLIPDLQTKVYDDIVITLNRNSSSRTLAHYQVLWLSENAMLEDLSLQLLHGMPRMHKRRIAREMGDLKFYDRSLAMEHEYQEGGKRAGR